ncbi:DNA polymerase III subunit delta [Patescibacteria group bacterium]|nr:DNA polymerase III subunit delta [Patescibacteria group bacterium]
MITFLYGPDIYRSRQELRRLIQEKKSNSDYLDFIRIDINDKGIDFFEEISKSINSISMFDNNKLIVIENIFSFDKEAQEEFIEKLKDFDKDLIVWDEKPDLRTKLFKFLEPNSKKFDLLKGSELRNWIKDYSKDIESSAIDLLIEYVGSDLWRMSNEIDKLLNYTKKIEKKDVELLVKPEFDLNIFNMVDALGDKDKKKAISLFKKHLNKGEDPFYLLSMFIYQFRNLIKVRSGGKLDLHPFVIKKTQHQARNFDVDELKKIYHSLLIIDFDSKIGKTDIKTALELFVVGL